MVVSRMTVRAQHHYVLGRFESSTTVGLVVHFEAGRGGAERALMMRTFEGEGSNAEPMVRAEICTVWQSPQGGNGAFGLLIDRPPLPVPRREHGHTGALTSPLCTRVVATTSASVRCTVVWSC